MEDGDKKYLRFARNFVIVRTQILNLKPSSTILALTQRRSASGPGFNSALIRPPAAKIYAVHGVILTSRWEGGAGADINGGISERIWRDRRGR